WLLGLLVTARSFLVVLFSCPPYFCSGCDHYRLLVVVYYFSDYTGVWSSGDWILSVTRQPWGCLRLSPQGCLGAFLFLCQGCLLGCGAILQHVTLWHVTLRAITLRISVERRSLVRSCALVRP